MRARHLDGVVAWVPAFAGMTFVAKGSATSWRYFSGLSTCTALRGSRASRWRD